MTTRLATALFALAVVAACVYAVRRARTVSCEVCVRFQGREDCRRARAETRAVAVRGAHESACAVLGAGLPERMQCRSQPPASVRCEGLEATRGERQRP